MIKTVFFFRNGNTAVFDEHGQQMPEVQASWLLVYVEHLEGYGVRPEDIHFRMPDGTQVEIFKTEMGWNWRLK